MQGKVHPNSIMVGYLSLIFPSYAINPARDLGPRVMISLCGWGWEAFSSHGWWFWIPVVCCHVGGIVGVVIHGVVVEHHWGTDREEEGKGKVREENQIGLTVGV